MIPSLTACHFRGSFAEKQISPLVFMILNHVFVSALQGVSIKQVFSSPDNTFQCDEISLMMFFIVHFREYESNWCLYVFFYFKNCFYLFLQMSSLYIIDERNLFHFILFFLHSGNNLEFVEFHPVIGVTVSHC